MVTTTDTTATYGAFRDRFMYKYLSLLLSSMQPPTSVYGTLIHRNITLQDIEVLDHIDIAPSPVLESPQGILPLPSNSSGLEPCDLIDSAGHQRFSTYERNCSNGSDSYQLYPLPLPHTLAIILAGTLLSFVTAGGNLLVILAFRLERQLQTISNYFLLSLAVCDLTIGLISIPFMTYYTARGQWDLGYTTCQFWLSIDYLMCNASVMNLLLISFDRYFSVTQPLTYRPRRTSRKAMIMIAGTFVMSILLWPPLIIFWPHIEGEFNIADNECIVQFLRTSPAVTVGTATVAFFGPVVIMVVLYSRVYYVTKTRHRQLLKLQAFHQKSIKRTVSEHSDSRIPLRATLSTTTSTSVTGHKVSSLTRNPLQSCGLETDIGFSTVYCNPNNNNNTNRSPNISRPRSRTTTLRSIEADAKPWGFQALFEHFAKPKPIESIPSTRQGSVASSGFEEEESLSDGSGETTTYMPEEHYPLRGAIQCGGHQPLHKAGSSTPSDYGSTLTGHFINYVRHSLLIRRRSKIELKRNPSILPSRRTRSMSNPQPVHCKLLHFANAGSYPHRYYQHPPPSSPSPRRALPILEVSRPRQQPQSPANRPRRATYDPANSPIQELRRMSAVSRISAKCASVTQSAPTPAITLSPRLQMTREESEEKREDGEDSLDDTPARSASTPAGAQSTLYTVLIRLGKAPEDDAQRPSPPPQEECSRKVSRNTPMITIFKNSAAECDNFSRDGSTSRLNSFSTADATSLTAPPAPGRRLSSASCMISDLQSAAQLSTQANISERKRSRSSESCSAASSNSGRSGRRKKANRLPSGKSLTDSTTGASYISTPNAKLCRTRRSGRERRYHESKAARTLSAILLAFIITWAPYNFIVCIESFHENSVSVFWFTLSYYLCYLNSAINPLLYALCNPTFRRTFWHIMTLNWRQLKNRRYRRRSPHHQATIALTAVAIATANRQAPGTGSLK